jgi:RHS repeat-associated protein
VSYLDSLYERRTSAAATEHVYYIPGPGGPLAEVRRRVASGGAVTSLPTRYLHRDNLGSIDTVSCMAGDPECPAHQVIELGISHDPFGGRSSWINDSKHLPASLGDPSNKYVRFTGHELDAEQGLINMKGRIYDPRTAQFLTPDPVVQAPFYGQSFNPYAYVLNNPTKYVDPTGAFASASAGDEIGIGDELGGGGDEGPGGRARALLGYWGEDNELRKAELVFYGCTFIGPKACPPGFFLGPRGGGGALPPSGPTLPPVTGGPVPNPPPSNPPPPGDPTPPPSPTPAPTVGTPGTGGVGSGRAGYGRVGGSRGPANGPARAARGDGSSTFSEGVNAVGFLADKVNASVDAATVAKVVDSTDTAAKALARGTRIGGGVADIISVVDSVRNDRIPLSGGFGLTAAILGAFATGPEGVAIGVLGAVGGFLLPDPAKKDIEAKVEGARVNFLSGILRAYGIPF